MGVGVLFEHHYFRCFVKLVSFRVSPRCHPVTNCNQRFTVTTALLSGQDLRVKVGRVRHPARGAKWTNSAARCESPRKLCFSSARCAAALRSLALSQLLGEILTISWVCTDSQDFSTSHVLSVLSRLFKTQSRT